MVLKAIIESACGFAVMADEVRKLTEKTMKVTQKVDEVGKAIQIGRRGNIRMMEDTASVEESSAR